MGLKVVFIGSPDDPIRIDQRGMVGLFTGDPINAQEAERLGLVNRVVPADELLKAAKELAAKIAKGPPIAIELIKRAVYRGIESDFDSQTYYESYVGKLSELTEDHHEGIQAFKEKREPEFRGR